MAEGVQTNNQRGRRSGPCRLWGGLDKARHIVPTALLVRVQCFRKSLLKAVQGPSTRPIVVSMINGWLWLWLCKMNAPSDNKVKNITKQEAQRATYRAPEYNVPPFWQISQGGNFCLLISLKNTNLVEDFEILLPVKFRWIPLSGFREEVENVSANQG